MDRFSNINVHSISSSEASVARKRRMDIIHHQKILQGKRRRDGSETGVRNRDNDMNKDLDAQLISSSDDDEHYCPTSTTLPLPPKKRKISVELLNTLASVSVSASVPPPATSITVASTTEVPVSVVDPVAVRGGTQQADKEMRQLNSGTNKNGQVLTKLSDDSSEQTANNTKEGKGRNVPSSTSTGISPSCKRKRGTKNQTKQKRYEPETPMTKEQTAAWRREARKVRNRQSAAKSREKIKNRINVLELEVEEWKTKYQKVLQRLQKLEKR